MKGKAVLKFQTVKNRGKSHKVLERKSNFECSNVRTSLMINREIVRKPLV
jgi:hypothetical protein